MTWRIRAYLATMLLRHWGTAAILFLDAPRFEVNPTFNVILQIAPTEFWVFAFAVVGASALVAATSKNKFMLARISVIMSVGLSIAWAVSLGLVRIDEPHSSMMLFIIYASLAMKDLIVSGIRFNEAALDKVSDLDLTNIEKMEEWIQE